MPATGPRQGQPAFAEGLRMLMGGWRGKVKSPWGLAQYPRRVENTWNSDQIIVSYGRDRAPLRIRRGTGAAARRARPRYARRDVGGVGAEPARLGGAGARPSRRHRSARAGAGAGGPPSAGGAGALPRVLGSSRRHLSRPRAGALAARRGGGAGRGALGSGGT